MGRFLSKQRNSKPILLTSLSITIHFSCFSYLTHDDITRKRK
ncbi:hypothetical protein A1Q2_08512 (mitochondrion) [Trichosporon asahii var. asahii CBS 8904]|uniref:Uncharacterized protein n=2 Tax=Trichosporon asahii var. asahii TaxID=189963 RepID=K1V933_TRIAC|nr:hypothetical protein A1Q1_00004 [Trichosporon asahii var. asahii CBS 2479]EJT45002.1 hypothetical protein A1Q1_00004 [Trichosporon asahii var. asahii CBS 2479]EKC97175.1 hypothetical protein A1Q2_08512 [Trichosporon asahii var. asahii CBS 8904]